MQTQRLGPPPKNTLRKIAITAVVGLILFAALWYTVFSAMTAAFVATGGAGLIIVGACASDVFESALETVLSALLAILGAIAAVFAAIFSIFE